MCTTTKYRPERRRCKDKCNQGEKNRHDATTFNWTTFSCWFETLSDKLQNVSSSVSAVLRQAL